jgi:prepilin peptidase CpaA
VALLVYFPLYVLRAMGAGDVKLMAALGAIVGAADWFGIFVLTGIFGGIGALLLIACKGRFRKTLWNVGYLLNEFVHLRAPYITREELDVKSSKAITMPHGLVISLGSIAFVIAGHIWGVK